MALPARPLSMEWLFKTGIYLATCLRGPQIQHCPADHWQPQGHTGRPALLRARSAGSGHLRLATGPAAQVVLPAAVPGIFAAVALGFGRAIGETMVVLMASGNASIVSSSVFDSARTITATIAAELGEVVFGGAHYRILFLIGVLLFAVTFLTNLSADLIMHRLRLRMEGKR